MKSNKISKVFGKKLGINGYVCFFLLQVLLVVNLQMNFWNDSDGIQRIWVLEEEIVQKTQQLEEAKLKNSLLHQEIQSLKVSGDALEERARLDLGLVKPDETFYLWTE